MYLRWSVLAQKDRKKIFNYIEADSPRAAADVDDYIRIQVEALMKFPEMGRPGRVNGTRELVVHHTPYIVAYSIQKDTVRILRVLHGAQLWPEEMT
jgi:addiction module RelE/StbE family toxin